MDNRPSIADLPSLDGSRRIHIVQVFDAVSGSPQLVLQEQDFAAGVGWFVQHSIELDEHQARLLRETLGSWLLLRTIEVEDEPRILPFPGLKR